MGLDPKAAIGIYLKSDYSEDRIGVVFKHPF
jgi:hypothetical protein